MMRAARRGTTLIVRDLFYNTPARMKFLKKDVSEANAVAGVVDRVALSSGGQRPLHSGWKGGAFNPRRWKANQRDLCGIREGFRHGSAPGGL